ncbi:MAG: HD-GYP domain-containing protein, partial [Nitrospiraceae bacterium]
KISPIHLHGDIVGVIYSAIDITRESNRDLLEVYASSISEMKNRELKAKNGKDAFFNMLEDINESYEELEDLFLKLVRVMINVLDAKSPWTKGHSERVSRYAEAIALEMDIDQDDIKDIKLAGLLHDIGKIGTSDYLLDKPGALTKDEFIQIKKHPSQGAHILKDIKQLKDIIPYIEHHHEKIDGSGYPLNLSGDRIPLGAKILHVADSFDSMTSDRPYRPAPGLEFALNELRTYKGSQFDPEVVDAFLKILSRSQNNSSG